MERSRYAWGRNGEVALRLALTAAAFGGLVAAAPGCGVFGAGCHTVQAWMHPPRILDAGAYRIAVRDGAQVDAVAWVSECGNIAGWAYGPEYLKHAPGVGMKVRERRRVRFRRDAKLQLETYKEFVAFANDELPNVTPTQYLISTHPRQGPLSVSGDARADPAPGIYVVSANGRGPAALLAVGIQPSGSGSDPSEPPDELWIAPRLSTGEAPWLAADLVAAGPVPSPAPDVSITLDYLFELAAMTIPGFLPADFDAVLVDEKAPQLNRGLFTLYQTALTAGWAMQPKDLGGGPEYWALVEGVYASPGAFWLDASAAFELTQACPATAGGQVPCTWSGFQGYVTARAAALQVAVTYWVVEPQPQAADGRTVPYHAHRTTPIRFVAAPGR